VETLEKIGPAVFNGAFSTFLAFIMLSYTDDYAFSVFFKVSNAGHHGTNAKAHRVKKDVVWTSLDGDVKKYVQHCVDCQKAKNF
jgi:hypothetical protein